MCRFLQNFYRSQIENKGVLVEGTEIFGKCDQEQRKVNTRKVVMKRLGDFVIMVCYGEGFGSQVR